MMWFLTLMLMVSVGMGGYWLGVNNPNRHGVHKEECSVVKVDYDPERDEDPSIAWGWE